MLQNMFPEGISETKSLCWEEKWSIETDLGDDFDVWLANWLKEASQFQHILSTSAIGERDEVNVKLTGDILNGALVPFPEQGQTILQFILLL